ncbi:MAG: hypothetical protein LLG05_09770, partial [Porphyromonadaceae bacterium]|nr:hypothetical protein [Porphyromonadaceae bacterium]
DSGQATVTGRYVTSPGVNQLYILIEKYTTFLLKSIPLKMFNALLCGIKSNIKTDDKDGYKTRNFKAVFP